MTLVNLRAVASGLGGWEPITNGLVAATYWAGLGRFQTVDGDEVRFSATIRVGITDGDPESDLTLTPTAGVCCVRWEVTDLDRDLRFEVFTSIPDTTSVDFGDLTVVDPASFAPAESTPTLVQTIDLRVEEYLTEHPPTASAAWGSVSGTLADQTDLQGALDLKADLSGLSGVATSGAYADLSGTPTLGTAAAANTGDFATAAQGSKADTAVQPGSLAAVATTGAYDDLSGKPTLGTAASAATGDFAAASHMHVSADVTDASSAATPSVMVLRDAAGRAKFADPAADADAATKGYVDGALDDKAPLASPALTGNPTAPTQTAGNDSTRLATTAFVQAAVAGARGLYVGVNAQTGTSYTLVLSDQGKLVTCSNGSAITVTIPPNSSVAFPVGAQVDVAVLGAGMVTFVEGSGVTVSGTPSLVTRAQSSAVTLIKLATDTWLVVGDLADA